MCLLLFQGRLSRPLIAMATMALQSGSHVLCFITNRTMTQYLSGFGAKKGVCAEKLLRGPEIMKVPLKQKHQEKPSSSLTAHTRPPVSLSVYLFLSRLLFQLMLSFPFFLHFSVCSFITVHATALKHLHVQCTLILALYF